MGSALPRDDAPRTPSRRRRNRQRPGPRLGRMSAPYVNRESWPLDAAATLLSLAYPWSSTSIRPHLKLLASGQLHIPEHDFLPMSFSRTGSSAGFSPPEVDGFQPPFDSAGTR
jgi:hypothetical protein